jgi:hypothetical protein
MGAAKQKELVSSLERGLQSRRIAEPHGSVSEHNETKTKGDKLHESTA